MTARRRRTPVPKATALATAVAGRIRTLRQAHGLTQAELGAPYLTRAAISSLERGLTSPSIHVIAFLGKKLRVKPKDFLPR